MKKIFIVCVSILLLMLSTITSFAGDIPESLMHSEDSQLFFGEVVYYHPNKENPDIEVSPVKVIKGNVKEGTKQIYSNFYVIGNFKVKEGSIYLFTYLDEVNPMYIFEVTTLDTKTLKLKNVEGYMWERLEEYLNQGKYGKAKIEDRNFLDIKIIYGLVFSICIIISTVIYFIYKKNYKNKR